MVEEKRFKVGDKLTYKFIKYLPDGKYCDGGSCQGGFIGKIKEYRRYSNQRKCWSILVESRDSFHLSMLEDEFIEYHGPMVKDMFPIY